MIIPADHTDFFPLNVPYEKNAKIDAKTNQVTADNRVAKYNKGYTEEALVSSQLVMGSPPTAGSCTTNPNEKIPQARNIPVSRSHRTISKYTIVGFLAMSPPPYHINSIV